MRPFCFSPTRQASWSDFQLETDGLESVLQRLATALELNLQAGTFPPYRVVPAQLVKSHAPLFRGSCHRQSQAGVVLAGVITSPERNADRRILGGIAGKRDLAHGRFRQKLAGLLAYRQPQKLTRSEEHTSELQSRPQ